MILTACYVYATFQQSWRITSICTKIAEKIKDKTSIVFYVLHSDINDATSATSELCTNRNNARICDFLWLKDNKRGCCLVPKQIVHLGPWVSFPSLPTLIPITTNYESSKALQIEENNKIYLLLETEITRHPSAEEAIDCDEAIKVEEFGKPIAWKMDSNLAILLETDLINFTKLLMTSFLRDRLIINDNLPLIRIESLNYGGTPQPYNEIKSHIQKHMTSRIKSNLTNSEWKKHIESLRGLSILANQASEYEYNKNRTEGKTGIIKPDLIPSKSIENLSVSPLNASTPIKSAPISPQISEAPTEILISPKRKLSTICNSIPIKTPAEGTPSQSPKKALEDVSKKASVVLTPPEEIVEEHKTFIIKTPKKLIVPKTVQRPAKPPNVLIYSNDSCVFDRTLTTLREVLEPDMYTIYPLTDEVAEQKVWMDNTSLLVVCGVISDDLRKIFVEFFLKGGHIMSLCSELFYEFFPEVQPTIEQLTSYTFGKWHHLRMGSKLPEKEFKVPTSVQLSEQNVSLGVIATVISNRTPSIILANSSNLNSSAIISQVHFENAIADDKDNESARIEVFACILQKYFNVSTIKPGSPGAKVVYQNAFFLGRHELKFGLLDFLKPDYDKNGMLNSRKLALKFCGPNESVPTASTNVLPILIHSCPADFSTVAYFDTLKTEDIGRLVIYAPVISSTMHVINDFTLAHGTAVIARQQSDGKGRGGNQWLSPEGCSMFSLQIHIPMDSPLGSRIPLVQHLISVAIVKAIRGIEGLQVSLYF
ncbi:HLCS family protein [Megaselia abdita]